MAQADSLDKVVGTYFAAVTAVPFVWKGTAFHPKPLRVAPAFFHDYACRLACAGCCPRFTLDYLPTDPQPDDLELRGVAIEVNGSARHVSVWSHMQAPNKERRFCDHVDLATGACGIHGRQPFSCDFETLRFVHAKDYTWLGTRPYGRGWNMMRVDGERGALCEFPKTSSDHARDEGVRKLQRLLEWARWFGLATYLPNVIDWASRGPHAHARVWRVDADGSIVSHDLNEATP